MSDAPNPADAAAQSAAAASTSGRHPPHPHRAGGKPRYWLAVLLLLLAVAAGVVIGVGGTIVYFDRKTFPARPKTEEIPGLIISRMREFFPVDSEEEGKLEGVIRSRLGEVARIRDTSRNDIREQFEGMGGEMERILGPDRYKTWDDYRKKRMGESHHNRRKRH